MSQAYRKVDFDELREAKHVVCVTYGSRDNHLNIVKADESGAVLYEGGRDVKNYTDEAGNELKGWPRSAADRTVFKRSKVSLIWAHVQVMPGEVKVVSPPFKYDYIQLPPEIRAIPAVAALYATRVAPTGGGLRS